jgi:hypothetical protein
MTKFTQVQYNDLILTVVPDDGDEYSQCGTKTRMALGGNVCIEWMGSI